MNRLQELINFGIGGLECYYSRYTNAQEKFLRDSYNAYRTSWNNAYSKDKDDKFPIGKHANLYRSYDEMITGKPLEVFTQIKKSAQFYPQIQGVEESDLLPQKIYEDLSRINGATSYILILYLVENQQKLQLSQKEILLQSRHE